MFCKVCTFLSLRKHQVEETQCLEGLLWQLFEREMFPPGILMFVKTLNLGLEYINYILLFCFQGLLF